MLAQEDKTLPEKWTVIANAEKAGLSGLGTIEGNTVKIPPLSALILVSDK